MNFDIESKFAQTKSGVVVEGGAGAGWNGVVQQSHSYNVTVRDTGKLS